LKQSGLVFLGAEDQRFHVHDALSAFTR